LKPRRIIEVGSGYSSCAMLDTSELFFGGGIECCFIEPHPELLLSLVKPEDRERQTFRLLAKKLQEVDLAEFAALGEGDILFVDSSHVAKVGSDVNHLFSNVLPMLNRGVHIHFHDIFHPFEYPKEWVYRGISWNEAYVLKAFLQYNGAFRITFFNTFLEHF